MGHLHPFSLDICASWHEVEEEASTRLHERALEELHVLEAEGKVVLLSAPRAGHGKTHLLGRVAKRMSGEAVIATIPWHSADDLTWAGCGRGVLHDLAEGKAANVVSLQMLCAGVLATLLRRLIQTGRIPSTDPVQALRVLSQNPMELFKEGGNARVIGDWFRRHFDQLRKPLAEISNIDVPEAAEDWLRGLFDYVDDPSPSHLAGLQMRIEEHSAQQVPRMLRLFTAWRPLVMVADHMDGLYRDPTSGVAVARMTLALTSLPGVHVVLSVNQDLWETTFGRQLPSALEDRLNAHNVTLHGLTSPDATDLVILRLREAGVGAADALDFMRFIDVERYFFGRPVGSVSARGFLRHAAQMWRMWLQMDPGDNRAGDDDGLPAEGFLMEPAPAPAPGAMPPPVPLQSEEEENVQKLADHFAAEAASGGKVISLSSPAAPGGASPLFGGVAPAIAPVVFASAPPPLPPPLAPTNPPPVNLTSPVPTAQAGMLASPTAEAMLGETAAPAVEAAPQKSRGEEVAAGEGPVTTFQRLRQMLAKLKDTESVPLSDTVAGGQGGTPAGTNGTHEVETAQAAGNPLQSRYEHLRQEIGATPRSTYVELPVITDLVRLAGRRFPVVNFDEVELPGLLGRSLPRWSLHGMELVFGLEDFADSRYWKTVASFMAGRFAELNASAMAGNLAVPPQLKLMVFKGDMESAAFATLLHDETIPTVLQNVVDAVHLDPRSLASLYAVHQIVRETETGALEADTNAVLGILANELDFFWKRVTRGKV